jgi:DNA primase catalytic subunit
VTSAFNRQGKKSPSVMDILENDFGFSQNEMRVFFSGHRGYHVHIESEVVRSLDAMSQAKKSLITLRAWV